MIGAQLQKAIFDALTAAPAVAGGRVHDTVPAAPVFPYVTIGEEQVIEDGNACDDGWEVFATIHVWSRQPGFPEAKAIAAAAVQRLRSIATVTSFTVIAAELETSRAFRDPDGLTSHVAASVRFVLTPA